MITSALCNSYMNELPQGLHNFQPTGDVFKLALYDDSATLNASTTTYTATGESSGTGYTAGGAIITSVTPVLSGSISILDFADFTFSTVTLSNVRGALIYNSTNGNRAVAVLRFNSLVAATSQDVKIIFPGATVNTAILRITNNG
tara:strand:+ start:1474 stop:1908 length:435 start_codon:yes stop_codon:yes gene_type:complete